jgi:hypothetical protein
MPWEAETLARPRLQLAGAVNLAENSEEVLKWFVSTGAKHWAITWIGTLWMLPQ